MRNFFSQALKLSIIAAFLSGNALAETPTAQRSAKTPAKTETKKAEKTKAKDTEKKKVPTSADFTPTAEDLTDDSTAKNPEEEIKKLQDQRWVDQGAIEQPKAVNSNPGKVTMTGSCTDRNNKSYNTDDPGYQTCMQDVSDTAKQKAGSDKSGVEMAPTGDPNAPKGNVGVQFKVGN